VVGVQPVRKSWSAWADELAAVLPAGPPAPGEYLGQALDDPVASAAVSWDEVVRPTPLADIAGVAAEASGLVRPEGVTVLDGFFGDRPVICLDPAAPGGGYASGALFMPPGTVVEPLPGGEALGRAARGMADVVRRIQDDLCRGLGVPPRGEVRADEPSVVWHPVPGYGPEGRGGG
jgi:hypothetical protein